jgi:hypothetical protein
MNRIVVILLFAPVFCFSQNNIVANPGLAQTDGAPTFRPGARGSIVALDTQTMDWYISMDRNTTNWIKMGSVVQKITGCAAPAYTPEKYQSKVVTNTCATPELYEWNGSAWLCLTCASAGSTNLSWTEVSATLYRLNSSTGNDVFVREGSNVTAALSGDTLTFSSSGGIATVATDATLSGDGSGGDPLKIAQQSAVTSEVLMWTGATWEPSWGNPYTFVTSGATITSAVNEVLIGTLSGAAVFGLPSCNAALDGKRFKFVRNGTDTAYSVTIDPSSTEQFYDGTPTKIFFGKVSIDCTCRFNGGTGVWFFDNF